jgi:hypothetical protein
VNVRSAALAVIGKTPDLAPQGRQGGERSADREADAVRIAGITTAASPSASGRAAQRRPRQRPAVRGDETDVSPLSFDVMSFADR